MSNKISSKVEREMQAIVDSGKPFNKLDLEGILEADPNQKVLKRFPDGRIVPVNLEAMQRIIEMIIKEARLKRAKALAEPSKPRSDFADLVSPRQANKPSDKADDPKKLS